jgi:hypothetical protein
MSSSPNGRRPKMRRKDGWWSEADGGPKQSWLTRSKVGDVRVMMREERKPAYDVLWRKWTGGGCGREWMCRCHIYKWQPWSFKCFLVWVEKPRILEIALFRPGCEGRGISFPSGPRISRDES